MERRALLRATGGWALAGFGAVGLSACARSEPVQNVEGAGFQGRAPLRQRAEQIKRAGAGLGEPGAGTGGDRGELGGGDPLAPPGPNG